MDRKRWNMTFLLGVVIGGLAMWRWRGVVQQLAHGTRHPTAAPSVEPGAGERADSGPRGTSNSEGTETSDIRNNSEDVEVAPSRPTVGLN
jgi:hypothetical protein